MKQKEIPKEKVLWEIGNLTKSSDSRKRRELIDAIMDYFGEYEGMLILKAILFFKRPGKYRTLADEVLKALKEH